MAEIEDVLISELPRAAAFESGDLLVLQRGEEALAVPETVLIAALTQAADGHGGINRIRQTGSSGDAVLGITRTYTVYYADGTSWSFEIKDGRQGAQGAQGPKGDTGDPARATGSSTQYGVSDTADNPPTTWSDSPPAGTGGQYMWAKVTIVYNDATIVSYNVVSRLGRDGSGAVSSVNSVAPDSAGNVALTAEDIGYGKSNVGKALDNKQGKITASGLLKGDRTEGVSAAVAGKDYQAPAKTLKMTLALNGDLINVKDNVRYSIWNFRNQPVTTGNIVIAAPAPGSMDAWMQSGLYCDDVKLNGVINFICRESKKPSVDVTAYVVII